MGFETDVNDTDGRFCIEVWLGPNLWILDRNNTEC